MDKTVAGRAGPAPIRGGRFKPKGRALDPAAQDEIRALIGPGRRRRDLLIENLHLVQDRFGHLGAAHLRALAEEMALSQAEIFEVASFYAHFDLIAEDAPPPPALTARVCDSVSCMLAGADALKAALERGLDANAVRVVRAPCMGRCDAAPVVEIGKRHLERATPERVAAVIADGDHAPEIPAHQGLDAYRAAGGYGVLGRCRSGALSYATVSETVMESGLRGLGGAGFPSARKWEFVRSGAKPRLVCVNADEGEPGTFKDRQILETTPHRMLEGMLIAAWAVEADRAIVYLRDEYPGARKILVAEIAALEAAGLVAPGFVELRRGAGAYICGEESAMIESIEGKRGLPRHRPPYVASVGAFGRPTLVHNVETLSWLPEIVDRGAAWFAGQGKPGHKGLRRYSVSGRVRQPGVKLAPAGISARELIEDHCGGMLDGHRFAAYLPGGASGGILPARLGDEPLDFGTLEKHGCFVGSHALIVLSDRDDVAAVALNLMRFFADESCGQCTPCRVGCEKSVGLIEAGRWSDGLLEELCQTMADASICGLGQAAPNPIRSVLRFFPEALS